MKYKNAVIKHVICEVIKQDIYFVFINDILRTINALTVN